MKVVSNTRPCSTLGGTTSNGGEGADGCHILHINDWQRPLVIGRFFVGVFQHFCSIANALLSRQGDHWKAKKSDDANSMQRTMTEARRARMYSAPEARIPNQTAKVCIAECIAN